MFFLDISSDARQRKLCKMNKTIALEINVKTASSLTSVSAVHIA